MGSDPAALAGDGTAEPEPEPEPESNAGLDLLTDYDRNLWTGPEGWSDEQWTWKRRLRWDRQCDYLGEVHTSPLAEDVLFVRVDCVAGAYQGLHYLYVYDSAASQAHAIALPEPSLARESAERPFAVWGRIEFDQASRRLSILHLSRGAGDCGALEVYALDATNGEVELASMRQRECSEEPLPDDPAPAHFDPHTWPKVI